MRINNFEEQIVNQFNRTFTGNTDVLKDRNISASGRVSLANVAAGTSVSTDELLAVMNYRVRRGSTRQQPVARTEEATGVL
jgi:hypothetical protein